jgi:hypothetical protein
MANHTLTVICAAICLDAVRRLYGFYRAGTVDSLAFVIVLWSLFYIGIPSVLFAYFGELNINGSMVRPQAEAFAVPLLFQVFLNIALGNRYFSSRPGTIELRAHDAEAFLLILLVVTAANTVSLLRVAGAVLTSGAYELAGGELREAAYGALAETSTNVEHVARVVGLAIAGVLLKARRIGWSAIVFIAPVILVDVITLGRYLTISALFMYVWARPEIVRSKLMVGGIVVATLALFYYRTFMIHIATDTGEQYIASAFFSTENNQFEILGEFINTYATFHMAAQAVGSFDALTQAVNVFSYLLPPGAGGSFLGALGVPSIVEVATAQILKEFGAHPAHLSAIDLYVYSYFAVLVVILPVVVTFLVARGRVHPTTAFLACYLFVTSFACLRGSVLYYYSRAAFVLALFALAFIVVREAVGVIKRGSAASPARG